MSEHRLQIVTRDDGGTMHVRQWDISPQAAETISGWMGKPGMEGLVGPEAAAELDQWAGKAVFRDD